MDDRANPSTDNVLHTTDFPGLQLWRRGKVRDVYELDDALLIIATDRISAFDVVMNEPIPDKGRILTAISLWWFEQLTDIVDHHVISSDVRDLPAACDPYRDVIEGRFMLVEKTEPFPVECVARGYLAGSGWREYIDNGAVCGVQLPEGLQRADRLPNPIFTPATKAEEGHDENISFGRTIEIIGEQDAALLRDLTLAIYDKALRIAEEHGLILADTKFEFGRRENGSVILIDEVLTPDSSRYWLTSDYAPGREPVNFDKQYVRDWLGEQDWDKTPPPPALPLDVIQGTTKRYRDALRMLTGKDLHKNV